MDTDNHDCGNRNDDEDTSSPSGNAEPETQRRWDNNVYQPPPPIPAGIAEFDTQRRHENDPDNSACDNEKEEVCSFADTVATA